MKKLFTFFTLILITRMAIAQCTPSAAFTVSQTPTGSAPLRVTLSTTQATSTYPLFDQNYITWGDGNYSYSSHSSFSGTHDYATPGTYSINYYLMKMDSLSMTMVCGDTVTQSITVSYPPCATSIYSFEPSPGTFYFIGNNLTGTSGLTYSWNFGDGTSATGDTVYHTYSYTSYTSKTVTLTVTGPNCTSTVTKVIYMGNNCAIDSAYFSQYDNGLQIYFYDYSTYGGLRTFNWNFGDGNTSSAQNPTHTYASAGTYLVTLITTWDSTCTDTFKKNITVSPLSNPTVEGFIWADTTMASYTPAYKVWLISFDSATNILSAVDSITTLSGAWVYYTFNNVANGQYRVKAAVTNSPSSGTGWVPTYSDSSLMWNTANVVTCYGGNTYANIFMKMGTVTSGPGFVGGNVTMGANKGTSSGVKGIMMYLLDMNNKLIKAAETDANGNYSFGQIPDGMYTVYPELMGYKTSPTIVNINNSKVKYENVNFKISESGKTIMPAPVSVINITNQLVYNVYPNPTSGKTSIIWNANVTTNASVVITDITGKKVYQSTISTNGNTELDLSNLQKGLYFISVSADTMQQTQKLILK